MRRKAHTASQHRYWPQANTPGFCFGAFSWELRYHVWPLHSNAADRDHTILAAIGRFWYGETGTAEAATYVVLFMLILMGTLLINLPGAVEEANRRKQNASVKAKLATAAEYTKELQPIVKAFEKEQREALRQEYGDYLQPLDLDSLQSISKAL